ncbi:hypothetical protein Aduo_006807 [Ancylostoma duodenale]
MAGALVVCGCVVSVSLWMLSKRNRVKNFPANEEDAPSPQKIDSEVINLSEFQDRGPLVLQARMKGRIKHALDDDKSFSLKEVQFDTKHNEIFTIGSDIEQLDGMSQLSLLSGERSREVVKGPKRGSFPTMASEAKKAEAAAREAKRVAENERMIALCAERRRARDAAAASSSKSDGKSQPRTSSDDVKSEGIRSDSRKIEVPKFEQRSVLVTQRTQASTMSQVREPSRRQAVPSTGHRHYDPKPSRAKTGTGAAYPIRKSPSAPAARRRVSRNRRKLDGPVVKNHATDSSSSSSSRSKKMPPKSTQLQESRGEVQSPPSH